MLHKQSRTWTIFLIFRSKRAAGDSLLWMCSLAPPFSAQTIPFLLYSYCVITEQVLCADRRWVLCATDMLPKRIIVLCLRSLLLFSCLLHVLVVVRSAPLSDLQLEDPTRVDRSQDVERERRAFLQISSVSLLVTSAGNSFRFYLSANIHCLSDKYEGAKNGICSFYTNHLITSPKITVICWDWQNDVYD